MAKKTHIKVRLVPESKPDSAFFYYVKKPAGGEKAKVKFTKPHILEIDGQVLWCVPLEGGGYKLRLEVKDISKLLG